MNIGENEAEEFNKPSRKIVGRGEGCITAIAPPPWKKPEKTTADEASKLQSRRCFRI
uniref:Uncharacterized protein n=1 Tax=Cucumis melo TaxID=3656 RepID=A0A9I9DT82_CUCME